MINLGALVPPFVAMVALVLSCQGDTFPKGAGAAGRGVQVFGEGFGSGCLFLRSVGSNGRCRVQSGDSGDRGLGLLRILTAAPKPHQNQPNSGKKRSSIRV